MRICEETRRQTLQLKRKKKERKKKMGNFKCEDLFILSAIAITKNERLKNKKKENKR
jgi:hypothetical protein